MFAEREQQIAVAPLHDAAAEVIAARERAFLAEDHLHVVELRRLAVGETRARHRGAPAARCRFGEAEIDRLVGGEVAVERDIVQAALAGRADRRHAGNRRRKLAVALTTRRRPGRSVTSIRPSGRNASPHG